MAKDIEEQLTKQLESLPHAPFLFVGSGLSRRYYGLPDWPGLLRELASDCGINYEQVYSSQNGNLPKIASILSEIFHPIWFKDEKFSASREKFSGLIKTVDDPLKIETANLISSKQTFISEY